MAFWLGDGRILHATGREGVDTSSRRRSRRSSGAPQGARPTRPRRQR